MNMRHYSTCARVMGKKVVIITSCKTNRCAQILHALLNNFSRQTHKNTSGAWSLNVGCTTHSRPTEGERGHGGQKYLHVLSDLLFP